MQLIDGSQNTILNEISQSQMVRYEYSMVPFLWHTGEAAPMKIENRFVDIECSG